MKIPFWGNPTNDWASITEAAVVSKPYGCALTGAVKAIDASTAEPVNPPANAVDGNLATRWSGQGYGASLVLDLGTPQLLCGTKLAWHQGNTRWNDFTVYTSVDGTSYLKAWEGRSSGTTTAPEIQAFPGAPRSGRFVKITFWTNPVDNWGSIAEAAVRVST
ncbi:discoidin domain-containing protein [Kribbella sp. CA-293567]|uniref:discoidin domain-containing protein n=1 Tax=Kribbella sp. CA-293567 TaxID=3002436 RepID=UPI0022DDE0DE|nr:discoidin domain-containing protein [Kribbella sp. CA-293567]WBQ03611.1 discoidin domain-containing protein [Kribbella sp. CA-293567]